MVTQQRLSKLPEIETLKKLCQSLATLELTSQTVETLNPEASLETLRTDLEEIDYPQDL